MHEAALLLGLFSLVSQLIGLLRDRMLADRIGPSATLDIYYAAFQIPNFIYISVASLASITVLMPFMISRMDESGRESARAFFNNILSGFLLLLTVASIGVFILMPKLANIVAPGFTADQTETLVWMSRIMLLSPIFMGVSNLVGTVTQLLRKFFIFALSPIFYNLGIIFGIVVLYPRYGIHGLAFGVALGALMHLLVQLPTLIAAGFTPRLSTRLQRSSLKEVVTISLPRTLGVSMNSIALLVIISIASTLDSGAISIFNFALNLETTPVGIIGISYAVASFPLLAETFSRGKRDVWEAHIFSAIRQIIFWSLPITALFIVFRAHIVRITLGAGAFSWSDTRLTAAAFALFSIGLIGQNVIHVIVRAFYSAHDTKRPLFINIFSSILLVLLALGLSRVFTTVPAFRGFIESTLRVKGLPGTEVLMLPLAYSIGTLFNAWMQWLVLKRFYVKSTGQITRALVHNGIAAIMLGISSYVTLQIVSRITGVATFWTVFFEAVVSSFVGISIAIMILAFFKNEQLAHLYSALKQKFWKTDLVHPEQKPEV
jgi:putative peptidoglycan lipid II flippase